MWLKRDALVVHEVDGEVEQFETASKAKHHNSIGLSFLISAVSAAICLVRSFSFMVSIDRMYCEG